MCGLIAMITKTPGGFHYKAGETFSQLLYAGALRGMDSTGVFGINKYGNLKLHKAATPSAEFMRTKTFENFDKDIFQSMRVVVGHNRASTRGATTDENAHPFLEGHTCLVHNGTLHSHKHMADVAVDSHAICHAFDTKDYKEVIPNDIDGAFALIWYDGKEKKLHISRNKERQLWIVETPTCDYIASEPQMLMWILERTGVPKPEPAYFEVGKVYTYDIDKLEDGFTVEELPEKKHKPVGGNTHAVVYGGHLGLVETYKRDKNGRFQSSNGYGAPFYKNYRYGASIVFEHKSNTIIGDTIHFRGETIDGEGIEVIVEATNTPLNIGMVTADYIEGTISGASWRNGIPKIILNKDSIREIEYYQSCNGVIVSSSEIQAHGGSCDDCGAFIDEIIDEGKFWVRYKNNKIKSMKCPVCVETDEHLKHLLEQDAA